MAGSILNTAGSVVHLIRYRFLLFAGLIPFALGQAIAWHEKRTFQQFPFVAALAGLSFVLIGVEAFNEYFDAKIGTDRVFSLEREDVPRSRFFIGIASFALAACVMIILTIKIGLPVLVFSMAGALAACFYVTPPVKLAYRGLGEIAILLSYGPMMTAGSYFIQTGHIDRAPFVASVVPALLILGVTVINEIPDFYGDRIVGKRNMTVRLGRERAVSLYGLSHTLPFIFVILGVALNILPVFALLSLLCFPLVVRNFFIARRNIANPHDFIPAIRGAVLVYSMSVILLAVSYLIG